MTIRSASGEVNFTVQSTIQNTLTDGSVATSGVGGTIFQAQFTDGVGDNQISRVWFRTGNARLVITNGNFRDIDLAGMGGEDIGAGSSKDALGLAMDNEELAALIIKNESDSTGSLEIMKTVPGAAPIAWMPQGTAQVSTNGGIKPGGARIWAEPSNLGLLVTTAVSNVLRLTANGGTCNVSIYTLGRHDTDESSSNTTSSSASTESSSSSASSQSSSSP